MRTAEAIEHFKTQQGVATALGMAQSSVAEWGEYPPPARQLQIERVTAGALVAEPDVFSQINRRTPKRKPETNGA